MSRLDRGHPYLGRGSRTSHSIPPILAMGQALEPRVTRTYQSFSGENLEQFEKESSIPEIGVEVLDAAVDAAEVNIDPFRERLLLHVLTLN